MPRYLVSVSAAVTAIVAVHVNAESIRPQPEPGLWRSEARTLINGQDLMAQMRAAQQQALEGLPAEQRAQMQSMLESQGDPGVQTECITADQAAKMADPEAILAEAREQMQNCEIEIDQASDSTLSFTGRCEGNEGFTGDMQGELTMVSSREMRSRFTGKGVYEMDVGDMPPGQPGMDGGPVEIQHSETTRWVAAECGAVPPVSSR
ncbi:DUF3617 domain-containing protein [Halopseudomonas nanhaiensis]|uniref:DUF3617 domain-containing protein n=1 Tax=Halopseudomonas nanhaiensis TaxID=2830842 RepID=UPI001CBF420B|nr:DUF3617 domain-containing protein [Halopseudomonas nanhaiensis]UAW98790.1 DUF3617 domain-containing protein [Halopseudomonas nanhaiensis]